MKKEYNLRHLILSGIFIAIGILLPLLLHSIPNGGRIFLPMHLSVMVAAFFLLPPYAVAVGILTPLLSALVTGMPSMAPLPMVIIMPFELATYALVISLLRKKVYHTRGNLLAPLLAVVPAMVLGRMVAGLVLFALVTFFGFKGPSMLTYVWGAVVMGLIGISVQLVTIPMLYRLLVNALPGWKRA